MVVAYRQMSNFSAMPWREHVAFYEIITTGANSRAETELTPGF